ncbi:MAG: MotA/TolQ/ExbB proton channel family protein [Bacteroidia bacterium]|nr:MotA/TolQ/ExbB proton channel family protein [Bacteroidia bacterium]MCZ2277341.1 MotA/TolQ/ExbB proton channel family protein [Bacteroidia bacterium]
MILQIQQNTISDMTAQIAAPVQNETISIFDLALKGGPIMIPILLCSIIAIYIMIERYFAIRKATKDEKGFMDNIRDNIVNGNITAARALCRNTASPVARMIEKGIARIGKPLSDIEKAIENVGNIEVVKLEKGLSLLGTCAGAAPMLGFLGTVTGMIRAFYNMSKAGKTVEISTLSGGMYEAMVTTVAGLIVGIVALVGYNLLSAMIQKAVYKMENSSIEFLDLLQEPAK